MNSKGLLLLQMAAAMTSVDDVYNPYHQERVRRENEEHRKRKKANAKRMADMNRKRFGEKSMSKFIIKGHEIEAYSRKDAIAKLKHKDLKRISIEIEQNKEDMEEKYSELTDIVHEYMDKDMTYKDFKEAIDDWVDDYIANKESNKPNLKPFDLQQAKEGKPVCTRDGHRVRIVCFDRYDERSIIGLISYDEGEFVHEYLANGKSYKNRDDDCDLMMLPEKKEGWVNIVRGSDGRPHMGRGIFQSIIVR